MLISPFVTILAMYGVVLFGALMLLVWAFNGRFDISGRLFVVSEMLRLPVVVILILVHAFPEYRSGLTNLVINIIFWPSEAIFVLSLYALSRGHGFKHAKLVCLGTVGICLIIEAIRLEYPDVPLLLYSIISGFICLTGVIVCSSASQNGDPGTPFWRVLKYIESAFVLLAALRIVMFFTLSGFAPTQGGTLNLIVLAGILALLIFRYIAYQAIWMTWVPPAGDENRLNQNLIRTLRERDRILKRLLASNRRIGVSALASSIAHQLSQPLTGAALYIETVKRNLSVQGGQPESIDAMERVSRQLQKMSSLVLNLRSLFTERQSNFTPTSLIELSNEIIESSANSSLGKNVSFEKNYEADPLILGDAVQLQQVLINIFENALQALKANGPAKPYIKVKITQSDTHAIVLVEDNGGGIHPDYLPVLFELYETTKDDGGGIGLWLCRTIIEKHGGRITANNIAHAGAQLKIELPLIGSPV